MISGHYALRYRIHGEWRELTGFETPKKAAAYARKTAAAHWEVYVVVRKNWYRVQGF